MVIGYLRMVLPALLVLLISIHRIESFQLGPKKAQIDTPTFRFSSNRQLNLIKSSEQQKPLSTLPFGSTPPSSTEINAKKKKVADKEPEREKKNGLELVLLYMTPWRNPNSIFVYMIGTLILLGKYSEAQSLAANSGAI